jgi:hypothetical protein
VSEKELEKRLAALRAVLEEMQGGAGESGSAAFRCIACDRVLPDATSWKTLKQAAGAAKKPHPAPAYNPSGPSNRRGGASSSSASASGAAARHRIAQPTGQERIYRAGFPMVNPKIRPEHRKLDHSRTFGRNMRPASTSAIHSAAAAHESSGELVAGASAGEWDFQKGGGDGDSSGGSFNSQGWGPAGFGSRPRTSGGAATVPRAAVSASTSLPAFGTPWPAATHPFDNHARDPAGGEMLMMEPGASASSVASGSSRNERPRPRTSDTMSRRAALRGV